MLHTWYRWSPWGGHDGPNASAECQHDGPGGCGWYEEALTLRAATRRAEDHAVAHGHVVMVERTLSRFVEPLQPRRDA